MGGHKAAASLKTGLETTKVVNAVRHVIVVEAERVVGLSAYWRQCESVVVASSQNVGIKALSRWRWAGLKNRRISLKQILAQDNSSVTTGSIHNNKGSQINSYRWQGAIRRKNIPIHKVDGASWLFLRSPLRHNCIQLCYVCLRVKCDCGIAEVEAARRSACNKHKSDDQGTDHYKFSVLSSCW